MAIIAKIRKHAGLAVGLIGVAIVGFVVQDAFGRRGQSAPPLAVINGETVSYSLFAEQVDQITEQFKRAQGADVRITEEDMNQIRSMAWQRILGDYLLNEACGRTGLTVSADEMNDMYYGQFISRYLYPYFTNPQTGEYDRMQVMNIINNFDQLSEQDQAALLDLEKVIKNERLKEKYYVLVSQSYYMPKALAATELAAQAPVYTARYVELPYAEIADADITLSKADYQKYYNENKFRFRQNKSRNIDYVVFDVTPTPQDMADLDRQVADLYAEFQTEENIPDFVNAVTSGDRFDSIYRNQSEILPGWDTLFSTSKGTFIAPRRIGRTYQMAKLMDAQMRPDSLHINHIFLSYTEAGSQSGRNKEQSRHLADSLVNVINAAPAMFPQLAAQYSEDPSAAQNGGDMGWQRDGYFVGFLNNAILSTPQGRATMVEGPNGFHVMYVVEKTAPVKKVLAAIVTIPIEPSEATTKAVYTQANQLLGQCKGTLKGLDSAAVRMGVRVRQAASDELGTALPGVPQAREVVRWAYDKNSKEGRVADRIFEMENRYVVAGLRSINETDYISLARAMEIPQVEYLVKQDKKFDELAERMKSASSLEELASKLNVAVDTAYGLSLGSYPLVGNSVEPAVLGAVCGLQSGVLSAPIKGNSGVYRVMVDKVDENAVEPSQVDNLVQMRQNQFSQAAANYVGVALEKAATIKDNRGFYF